MVTKKALLAAAVVATVVVSFSVWYFYFNRPSFIPLGEDPSIILPTYELDHLDYMQGFGQIMPDYYHNGIDFGVNQTTMFVAPHECIVKGIQFYFNERGGHWQTNVGLLINEEWAIWFAFESWALNESYGQIQRDAILVEVGQHLMANETIGNLLVHGEYAHVHFQVNTYDDAVCPYQFFNSQAKLLFDSVFYKINITANICL